MKFYYNIFVDLREIWKTGLTADMTLENTYKSDGQANKYTRVITTTRFLDIWMRELKFVGLQALPGYVSLLRFHDIHNDDKFGQAVPVFVDRVRKDMTEKGNIALAGMIAHHFIAEILNPRITLNPERAMKQVDAAAELLDIVVRLDPDEILCNGEGLVRLALDGLAEQICTNPLFQQKQEGKLQKKFHPMKRTRQPRIP